MSAGIIGVIVAFLQLALVIIPEILASQKRAREANEKWALDEKTKQDILENCLVRLRKQQAADNRDIQNMEDGMDRDLNSKK